MFSRFCALVFGLVPLLALLVLLIFFPGLALAQEAAAEPGGILPWIVGNAQILFQIVGALVLLASLAARLTATDKDDEIVGWVQKALDYWSLGGLNRGRLIESESAQAEAEGQ